MKRRRKKPVKRAAAQNMENIHTRLRIARGELKRPTEKAGSDALRALMQQKGWQTGKLHGNEFQSGWPDLYAHHPEFGPRWIETKSYRPNHYLEKSQIIWIRKWEPFGVKLWVLRGPKDYPKLFMKPNWREYVAP